MAASERDHDARVSWWDETLRLPADDLVFLDETGTTTAMATRYAWAPRGQRANDSAPRNHGTNTTLISCMVHTGMGPSLLVDGAMTTEVFDANIEQLLVPWLRRGQIVILDNLSVHHSTRARALIEEAGCTIRFLPAYSPDYSPIEWAFSKLKTYLRRVATRTKDALDHAIANGLTAITPADAHGWFYGCGYVPLRQPL